MQRDTFARHDADQNGAWQGVPESTLREWLAVPDGLKLPPAVGRPQFWRVNLANYLLACEANSWATPNPGRMVLDKRNKYRRAVREQELHFGTEDGLPSDKFRLIALPPNLTWLLQLLDVGVHATLRSKLHTAIANAGNNIHRVHRQQRHLQGVHQAEHHCRLLEDWDRAAVCRAAAGGRAR
jgi:hypothetical protein